MSHANGPATEFDDEKGSTAKKRKIAPPLVRNSKTFGFRSPLDDFKGRNYKKKRINLNHIQTALMNKEKGVTSPDITWLQALASHQNFKMFTGFCVRFERWKSWNIGSQRANTRSNSDSGASFDKLVETPRHQTNRALSSTKQQRSNTKHYKTTKIEHSVH